MSEKQHHYLLVSNLRRHVQRCEQLLSKKKKQDFENKLAANVPIPILHFSTTDDAIPGFQIQETELCTERLVLSMISITCLLLNHQMSVSVVDPGAGPLIKSTPGRLQ